VDECYKNGAKRVYVNWNSQKIGRIAMKRGDKKNLAEVSPMDIAEQEFMNDNLPCMIYILSEDPDGLKGLNPAKMAYVRKERMKVLAPYREKREDKYQWCIAGAASPEWAKKVFPDLPKKKAVEKLWEVILETSRAADGNGIANWDAHDANLRKQYKKLNDMHLVALHYTSSNGTDLKVGLIPEVKWLGGGETLADGTFFQPNIPSEEIFTTPRKGEAEGIVYSAKPLAYQGNVIRNFWVKFENGKAVDVGAEEGEELLRSILSIDEGSAYLGECALVPYDSPINNTGILFYETLYDENAACHLALGRGFGMLYPGYENMDKDQLLEKGINWSSSHVDFMIGSKDLNIVGTTQDGQEIQIFKDGNWAI
ncbi:MAG: aminopeptidase, partial [Bacilli bacterium]|nr:aminopeptidase [Bacilli bacterium]